MGRSHVNTIQQPDENTCGPVSIQHALAIFGLKKSLSLLSRLCKTTSYGTTTQHMIGALRALRFSVLSVEEATLTHVLRALQSSPSEPRAVIVCYLYEKNEVEDGHWATISSYRASNSRIVLFDSYSGQKKSYAWDDFRVRWKDYELKRKKISPSKYRFIKKWRRHLMLVVAKSPENLPAFHIRSAIRYNA